MGNQRQQKSNPDHRPKHDQEYSNHDHLRDAEANLAFALSPATIMKLQRTIGNQAVQRLLKSREIAPRTGLIQTAPDPATPTTASTPESAPTAEHQSPPRSDPNEIIFEEGMFIGRPEFHNKALPKNQYYADHPPTHEWPYSDRLKHLWQAGQYNDFADEVAGLQVFRFKLPEDQVDGILGPKTSRKLRETSRNEAPSSPNGVPSMPQSTNAETAPPSPQSTNAETASPTTSESVPQSSTPTTDDPAVKNHPAANRILTPVNQAFSEYQAAEKTYDKANQAVENAKAEKAAKEEERQKTIGTMEQERAEARTVMAAARGQVAALNVSEFSGGEVELRRVKAYINQQLNAHTIYYTQMSNANILSGNGLTAAWRTCNMTVMSMILEALGKSSKDYNGGDLSSIQTIAANFSKELGVNNSKPEELASLRLPDFLQLVAIDIAGSREKAAGQITSHSFITRVARRFGLQLTEIKGGQAQSRGEKADSFLGTKFSSKLSTIGSLYRPAQSDALKEINKDATYKSLKGKERDAYKQQFIQDFTEKRRQQYVSNVATWIQIDTQTQEQLNLLRSELNKPNPADASTPRPFDAELQARMAETIGKLNEIEAAIPKGQEGKRKQLKVTIKTLEQARAQSSKKPDTPPKQLRALFDGKGNDDPLKQLEANLKKYEDLKGLYDKLGEEGGIEQVIPIEQYKASIIPTMEAAISAGNQVMVNLDNHFVRLQSVSDEGIVIDDPGSRYGEDNKVSWEQARKYGYFQHYLQLSS